MSNFNFIMSKAQNHSQINNNQLKMDFSIDLSIFSNNIKSNFSLIWDTIYKHAEQLQMIKSQLQRKSTDTQIKSRKQSRQSNKNSSKVFSLNYSLASDGSKDNNTSLINNFNPQINSIQQIQAPTVKQQTKQVKIVSPQNEVKKTKDQAIAIKQNQLQTSQNVITTLDKQKQIMLNLPQSQQKLLLSQNNHINDNQTQKLMQNKIFQLNQRLQKLQLSSIKQSTNLSKKLNQIKLQFQNNTIINQRKQAEVKKLQYQIDKFRGQLSQYKLKKQSQLMRMSNMGPSTANNTSNQFNQYLLDKIQQISNCVPEMLLKVQFQQYKAEIKGQINRMEKKLGDCVTEEQFNSLIASLSKRKINRLNKNQGQNKQKLENQKNSFETQIDPMVQLKLVSLQQSIKQLKQKLTILTQKNQQQNQKHTKKQNQLSQQLQSIQSSQVRILDKTVQHENFMRDMNDSYNEKIKQIISQIVQTQQSIQKISNQMKFYTYTNNKLQGQVTTNNTVGNSTNQLIEGGKVIDMQNDVNTLKKKVNKLTLKMQSLKQQVLNVRQDFVRDCDVIKANLQKKCDWQSLKKALHYFEQRVQQLVNYVESVQKSIRQTQDNTESTAAKRGWTCLCCDKDIKQFEGKLSEAKFTSIFPTRYQSPRIGGYYKQKQSNKEYNQIFLKHNRRLSQNQNKSINQI